MLILDLICYMSTGLFNKLLSSGHVLLLLLCGCLLGCLFSGWICGCLSGCLFSGWICGWLSGCLFFRFDMWMVIRLFIFQV